jgi:hypothetical protein
VKVSRRRQESSSRDQDLRRFNGYHPVPDPGGSLARLFRDRVAATPDAEAFRFPAAGGWESVTWAQVEHSVQRIVTVINADNAASLAMLRRLGEVEVSQVESGTRHVVVELPGTADFPDRPGCGRRSVPRVV